MDGPATPAEPDRITALWRRMKDHRIAQWTVGYVAVAYGIQHAVILTSESYEWPNIVARISMTLLALGLPLVMTFAWYHGERASRRVSGGEMAIVAALLVLISLVFYAVLRPTEHIAAAPAVQEASVTLARTAAASPKGTISVAVLPFLNLSSDKEQEFFSDGMTEEITAALAKVPDLRVVARTSAFEFKGKNIGIDKIGQQLHATHLIEGSVRKAGKRLRITAQLIKADDGTHVWAEDYDRDLNDVFAIQEDIARAITTSLHMTLGLKPGENLVKNRQIDPAAYTEYLRIRAKVTAAAIQTAREQAVTDLENLLARQPDFAPAWAFLAEVRVINTRPLFTGMWTRPVDQTRAMTDRLLQQAEHDAREAIRLDATQAVAYTALALIAGNRGNWEGAEDLLKKAVELDPNNPDVLISRAEFLLNTGHTDQALRVAREAQALDPLAPLANYVLGVSLFAENQAAATIELLEKTHPAGLGVWRALLAHAYAEIGQFDKAINSIQPNNDVQRASAALLRAVAAKRPPPGVQPHPDYSWIFAYAGQSERLMDAPERMLQVGLLVRTPVFIFDPSLAMVRKTERFRKFLRNAGLVDYWRAKGWPAQCHPTTGDEFECS